MTISEKINQDITDAMRARDEHRLTTLRMMKSGIRSREIDKRSPVDDQETIQILSTMIKQRKDSIDQFTKGGRPELAEKEAIEIKMIEEYMPKAAGEEEVTATVRATIAEMGSPTIKDMGTVMKNTMAKFQALGTRVDGKLVSEAVKRELSPK
ncbi:MAG: GatB/Yqey [Acidobacteriales bacterium]|nr:GatB/Yqey [Terriglobales bacterium]